MRIESVDEMNRDLEVGHELDVGHVGRALALRKFWIIAPVLVCFIGSVIAVNVIKPRYTAEAKILIENQESFFTRPDRTDRDAAPLPDDEAVQSQVQLVTSRDIARQSIKALDLQGDPEFDPIAGGLGPVYRLMVLLGLQPDPLRATAEDRLLSAYYDRLNVFPVVKSRVLSVQFTSTDPDMAAKAANTVAERYIALQSEAKRDSARSAGTSLASLIADLKVKVAVAETKAQEYRAQNGLLIGTNNTPIASQQLADITTQLAQARTAEADSQAKAKVLRDMIRANRVADVPDVANNDLIRRISEQRVTLKAQIAQQGMTLLPGHPRMKEMNAQLADIDSQLRVAGEKLVRQLENDAHIAAGRVENLKLALDSSKQTASTAGNDEVALRGLEQQARLLKEQLDFNMQKYQEAVARESSASAPADARVISRAVAPELPSYPKKLPTIAIVTFAGLVLSAGLVIARELLSGRAFADGGSSQRLPRAVSGGLEREADPAAPAELRTTLSEPAVVWPGADATRNLGDLLVTIKQHEAVTGAVRMMITGADDQVQVVPTALELARTLSDDSRVILVDCGGSSESFADMIETSSDEPLRGLGDLLAGQANFADVIYRDAISRTHLIPFGFHVETQDPQGFSVLMEALGETYDRVILAAAVPVPGSNLIGIDEVDLAVLLLSERQSTADVDACRAALYAAGAPAIYTLAAESLEGTETERAAA